MRKLLSLLLTLALCLGLMPAMAVPVHAASYDLWVGGVQVTSNNLVIDSTDNAAITSGSATYVPATRTLTLNNFVFEGAGYKEPDYHYYSAIYKYYDSDPLTIELIGTNSLSETGAAAHTNETYNNSYGIHADCDVTFTGSGTLTAKGGKASQLSEGLYINGLLKVPSSFTGTVTGKVDDAAGSTCACYGICAILATIESGTINAFGPSDIYGDSYGLRVDTGFTISGGTITATGKTKAVILPSKNYHITGNAEASTSIDGSNPVLFDINQIGTYLWFHYPSSITPVTPYDLYIDGVRVTSENAYDLSVLSAVAGTASYDATTNTLTLEGAVITSSGGGASAGYGINYRGDEDFTIEAKGANAVYVNGLSTTASSALVIGDPDDWTGSDPDPAMTINIADGASLSLMAGSVQKNHPASYGILNRGSGLLTIEGKGSLTAKGSVNSEYTYGIYSIGDLTIDGPTINALGYNTYGSYGIYANGIITINDGDITAKGGTSTDDTTVNTSVAIEATKGIEINAGTVNASAGDARRSYGITAVTSTGKLITISGGTVIAESSGGSHTQESIGLYAGYGTGVIISDGDVTASAGPATQRSFAIMGVYPTDAQIKITGGNVLAWTTSDTDSEYNRALSAAAALGSGISAGGSVNADGTDAVEYVAANNATYKWFKTPFTVTPSSFTVTLDPGEGSGTSTKYTVDSGNLFYFPECTFTAPGGKQFKAWSADNKEYAVDENITVIADVTATAIWEDIPTEPTFTLTYDANGGSGTMDPETYTSGAAIKLKSCGFTAPSGQKFKTWDIDGTEYAVGDGPVATADFTAKAIWEDAPPASGGGGTTTYPVKPASAENGNVTVAPRNAAEKSTVTITVTPDEGYVLDQLTVKDKDGNEIKAKDNGDGTFTIEMPASEIEVEATFKEAEDAPGTDDGFPFIDVPENSYFRKPVEWAVEKGITNGVSEDKYGPEMSCTRAQVVTFLWITCGSEDAGIETGFDDVDVAAYYDKAVAWAVEKGITAGTSENEFSPDMTITRAQFVTMLWAAKGMPEAAGEMPFLDVPADAYYAKAVAWAYANDITAGKSADSFAPDDPCTRAQIMTFLYNAYAE